MSNKNEFAFESKDLQLWYLNGKKHALKGIDIKIPTYQVTALIGPSGCGKSTFLRCLNKMNDMIEGVTVKGSILFDGKNELVDSNKVNGWKRLVTRSKDESISHLELRTRVGMVFQKPNPFPMSIYDNIAYGPRSNGIKSKKDLDKIVQNSLVDAALWEDVKNNLHDSALGLSGGQQQRLCIARALAMEPEVLLMDEPTSALDPIATSKIEAMLEKLKDKYTIIIVTHSMQQAARISDNTAFFYMGNLIEFDKTRKIFTHPKEKLTSDYITGKMG